MFSSLRRNIIVASCLACGLGFCIASVVTSLQVFQGSTSVERVREVDQESDGMAVTPPPVGNKRSDQFAHVTLINHEGKPVRFYEDLTKDKKIAVNFMYTICKGICPGMTANIKKVREQLAERGIDDVCFISVSIEPDKDTPERLAAYMEVNGIENRPGLCPWIFLTGDLADIDHLRKSMGVYDLDPKIDEDRTQHGGVLTFGNDRTNWWCASPALQPTDKLRDVIIRITRDRTSLTPGLPNAIPLASK